MKEIWGDGIPSWDTGTVSVAGDLTIQGRGVQRASTRLTIARGIEVHFLANPKVTPYSDDRDAARSAWSPRREKSPCALSRRLKWTPLAPKVYRGAHSRQDDGFLGRRPSSSISPHTGDLGLDRA